MQRNYKKIIFGIIIVIFLAVCCPLYISGAYAYGIDGGQSASDLLDAQVNTAEQAAPSLGKWEKKSFPEMAGTIIYYILGLLGVIFLVLIIFSGIMWMTAGGNEETVTKARGIIKGAIIGAIIILGSYALTYFVVDQVIKSTEKNSGGNAEIPVCGCVDTVNGSCQTQGYIGGGTCAPRCDYSTETCCCK
ncbi:MAG: hypothetical protein ABIJ91_04980 [Candidatus Kuenenbacteria bacterium]